MNEHIEEYLDIYLAKENIEYATLLTGEWGCGKTYFIRNYIKNKENKKEYKFIYVSLFGVKSISSINQRIFQELHPILSRKEIKALGGALLSALKIGVKIDLTGGDDKETSLNIDPSKLTLFNNQSYSDLIFIFDDLERTMIDFIEILGFINSLCEKNNSKVIIIANEDEIKSDHKECYKKLKEKIVGKSFHISNDTKSYWDNISNRHSEHLKENIEKIKSIFNEYGDKNYRNMNKIIEDYIDFSKKVEEKFLKNADFKSLLIEQFFTISLKYRKKFDIEETFKSLKDEKSTIFYNLIFDQEIWQTIITDFYTDNKELNEIIKLHYIFNEKEISSWQKLWHYRDLNENDFYENLNDVKSKFIKMEYSSFEIIMHAVSILIFFIKKEVEKDLSIVSIKEKINEYIEFYKDKKEQCTLSINHKVNRTGLGYINQNDEDFITIKEYFSNELESINRDIKNKNDITEFYKLLEHIKTDNFYDHDVYIQYEKYKYIDLLDKEHVGDILEIFGNNFQYLYKFCYFLDNRYSTNTYFNGSPLPKLLKSEKSFIEEFIARLPKNYVDTLSSFEKLQLAEILECLQTQKKKLEQYY